MIVFTSADFYILGEDKKMFIAVNSKRMIPYNEMIHMLKMKYTKAFAYEVDEYDDALDMYLIWDTYEPIARAQAMHKDMHKYMPAFQK